MSPDNPYLSSTLLPYAASIYLTTLTSSSLIYLDIWHQVIHLFSANLHRRWRRNGDTDFYFTINKWNFRHKHGEATKLTPTHYHICCTKIMYIPKRCNLWNIIQETEDPPEEPTATQYLTRRSRVMIQEKNKYSYATKCYATKRYCYWYQ